MKSFLRKLIGDRSGTQTVEMGLMLLLIVIGLIAAVKGVADENSGMFAVVSSKSAAAMASR